jgi:HEAT repeat protein
MEPERRLPGQAADRDAPLVLVTAERRVRHEHRQQRTHSLLGWALLLWTFAGGSLSCTPAEKKEPDGQNKALSDAVRMLKDPDVEVRRKGAGKIGELGAAGKEAVPALLVALKDPDARVRSNAAVSLCAIDRTHSREAVSVLVAALDDPNPYTRAMMALSLGGLGPEARGAVPALLKALKDPEAGVRRQAAMALGQIGPGEGGDAKEVVAALIAAVKDPATRQGAVGALVNFGSAAADAVPVLLEVLKEGDASVRVDAIQILGFGGRAAASKVVPVLMAALEDPDEMARGCATRALGMIGPTAQKAVPALLGVLQSARPGHRRDAAEALGRIGPAAKEAVLPLTAALKDQDREVRIEAAHALALIVPDRARTLVSVSDLVAGLREQSTHVKYRALQALATLGPAARAALPDVLAILPNQDAALRSGGCYALGAMGFAPESASALIAALKDKDLYVRLAAASALGELGPQAAAATTPLEACLQDGDAGVRLVAAGALARVDPAQAEQCVRLLVAGLQRQDPSLRLYSVRALWKCGRPKEAIPALVTALQAPDASVRNLAADVLGDFGPAAREAVPALRALRDNDPADNVRQTAADALRQIEHLKGE